ncbi:hypothetical protein GF378_01420 [Candidatus Pacearchaeota archaeon]|nr:hypothetical protein [Candidatus Pacearchaeota archaeon]
MTEEKEKAPETDAEENSEDKSEEEQEQATSEEDSKESEGKEDENDSKESEDSEESKPEEKGEDLDSEKPEEDSEDSDTEEVGEDDQGRKLYKTTCSKCGKECEVPFKPEKDRDVFCEDCFRSKRKRSFGSGSPRRRRNRQMHDATCAECGRDCQVPFKPTGDKPVYCKECYSKKREQ